MAAVAGVRVEAIGLRMGQALAAVFDEFDALRDGDEGKREGTTWLICT